MQRVVEALEQQVRATAGEVEIAPLLREFVTGREGVDEAGLAGQLQLGLGLGRPGAVEGELEAAIGPGRMPAPALQQRLEVGPVPGGVDAAALRARRLAAAGQAAQQRKNSAAVELRVGMRDQGRAPFRELRL